MDQYQVRMQNLAKQLKNAARKSSNAAAQFMVATARNMAPIKTGALRNGISDPIPKGGAIWEVSSSVPKEFPYHFWVNQNAGFVKVPMYWNAFKPTAYSDGSHRITGSPRYWSNAIGQTTRVFGRIARQNIGKVLGARVT